MQQPQETANRDPELEAIVSEEERCLSRVLEHVRQRTENKQERKEIDYDTQLLNLRDEIAAARMEDVPPLLEQMERLQGIAARARQVTEGYVDPRSPYFGRLVLREGDRTREVLIGRSTYLDSKAGVRIVDWRDAPVSRLYYRYNEGDAYEETFGDRDVEGEIVTRRSLAIVDGKLRRIVTPQGTFLHPDKGDWTRAGRHLKLSGGEGAALRAEQHHRPGKLGVGEIDITEDKHLKEITALIDPRQFELITQPDAGLVVIQGGAGSGKTTIGLHRLAYLAFQDKRRFRPDRMLVVVFNDALARYISQVLPALEVNGVAVRTYTAWAQRIVNSHFPALPKHYTDETPSVVTRLKKHPAMLRAIDDHVAMLASTFLDRFVKAAGKQADVSEKIAERWRSSEGRPLAHRIHALRSWTEQKGQRLPRATAHGLSREIQRALEQSRDCISAWAELLTDTERLGHSFSQTTHDPLNEREIKRAVEWCSVRSSLVLTEVEASQERSPDDSPESGSPNATVGDETHGIDGALIEERAELDHEDNTLLLRLHQRMCGPLLRPNGRDALVYEHILVDEAQDLSPVELAVVLGALSKAHSITLAGDVSQRLYMDNGFSGWEPVLEEVGLSHIAVEPLKLSYRSTHEIIEFARDVLGPLAPEHAPEAMRMGAPVELFRFAHSGDAVGFLAEALRELIQQEPRASVAVITRYPEQADLYYHGLKNAETPALRRVAEQDFAFKPGIDVTDVRQVKGLEFDYVVLAEVTESTFPADDESRHLLHIAATRAAHQLWVLASGKPSQLLPQELRDRGY